MSFDVEKIRAEFPVLQQQFDGKPLVYLDNAATTQKPQAVINALLDYYQHCNANVHRGAHRLADEATRRFEHARDQVAEFINAKHREEVIWTAGTTESINIIANGFKQRLTEHDVVIVSEMEHHANLIPWQQACHASGASLWIAPITDAGELDLAEFASLLQKAGENLACLAITHISNALGTVNPIRDIIQQVRQTSADALVLIDGAQGIAHGDVDVQQLDCDFYVFSGHKVFAPTGVGVLWGKSDLLADWPVWQTGGEMISEVSYQDASWNVLPYRLEAGTPNIADVVALGAAIDWLSTIDLTAMRAHEKALISKAGSLAADFDGLEVIGQAKDKLSVLSFIMHNGHPADIGFLLDRQAVAIRTGHHCAEPLMQRLGLPGTARASFALYNTLDEVDVFFAALDKVNTMLM
ncbi:MAG: cysteine desulfurase [Pseudomonadales bacterium]|nr:cysteine desulfurase [Pseudomonadales bacterium]